MMRQLLSAVAVLSLAITPARARDTYPRQEGVNPQHYVFALTLSDATDEIVATSSVICASRAMG